jgi:hypothetical protein
MFMAVLPLPQLQQPVLIYRRDAAVAAYFSLLSRRGVAAATYSF